MKRTNIRSLILTFAVVLMISLVSCDPAKKYEKEEASEIQAYLDSNPTLNFEQKESGLYYLEVVAGTGLTPVQHDTAYVKYTGKFLNGTVFDTNVGKSDTLKYPVGEGILLSGFEEGISYMKQGGKSILIVPSYLAYGPSGYYTIPGYTPLEFDLELVRVKRGPAGK
jgi:FKBP-type peptidyl-prolyl cis-trans isomerase FkpA